MPLDITLTPAATPSGSATPAPSGGGAPGLAALFGLLLAQTVGQPAPAGAPVKTATVIKAATAQSPLTDSLPVAPTPTGTNARTMKADPTNAVPTGSKPKDKATPTITPWPLPPPATVTPVASQTSAPVTAASGPTIRNAMDTAPDTGGELLPLPMPTPAPAVTMPQAMPPSVLVPTEPDVIVPTEGDAAPVTFPAALSATPQTPAVPDVALQPAQEIVLAASPLSSEPAQPSGTPSSPKTPSRPASLGATRNVPTAPQTPLQNAATPADNPSGDGAGKSTGLNTGPGTAATVTKTSASDKTGQGQTLPKASAEGAGPAPSAPVPTLTPPTLKPSEAARIAVTPMPPTDRTQMLRQVSDGLQTMALRAGGTGQRQVTLQLHPRDWGQVNVSVTMTPTTQADGKAATQVVAHIVADQPAVKAALETHRADLRQSLKDAGLTLDKMTVTVRPAEGGAQANLGDGRRESRSGDGGPFNPQSGASAQGGASDSGGSSSAFAAFSQGGQGRQQPAPGFVPVTPDEPVELSGAPLLTTMTGRVDTRA